MLDQFQGCCVGVVIGDSLGLPAEMKSALQVKEMGGILDLSSFTRDGKTWPTGTTSDDWALTHAIGKSLLRRKSFDLLDITLAHLSAVQDTFGFGGFGGGTLNSLEEIDKYFISFGVGGRSPLDSPELKNAGNGVAMKVAPLALQAVLEHRKTFEFNADPRVSFELSLMRYRISQVGKLTHGDPRAWVAGYAIAWMIAHILLLPSMKVEISKISYREWLLEELIKYCRIAEKIWNVPTTISDHLQLLLLPDLTSGPIEKLQKTVGNGFVCWESITFAIGMFLRRGLDFGPMLLETVNMGGDADSNTSMAGAMSGALVGYCNIPAKWKEYNETFKIAKSLGEDIFNM
jgi:ADP-ribosylglycohydrolase